MAELYFQILDKAKADLALVMHRATSSSVPSTVEIKLPGPSANKENAMARQAENFRFVGIDLQPNSTWLSSPLRAIWSRSMPR